MNSKSLLPSKKPLLYRQLLGKQGEDYATTYLQKKGYLILDRNFKGSYGELDIIALSPVPPSQRTVSRAVTHEFPFKKIVEQDSTLVFVEVKTRNGREYGIPEEAVQPKKLREVIKTAEYYRITHNHLPMSYRIDVIGIEMDEMGTIKYFNHLENVTL